MHTYIYTWNFQCLFSWLLFCKVLIEFCSKMHRFGTTLCEFHKTLTVGALALSYKNWKQGWWRQGVALYILVFLMFFLHGSFWRTISGAAKKGLAEWNQLSYELTWLPVLHGRASMWEESWLSLGLFMTHFVIKGLPASAMFSSAGEAVWKSCVDDNLVFSETVPAVWAFWDRAISREAYGWGRGSGAEWLLSMCRVLGSVPSPTSSKSGWYWSVVDGYCLIDSLLSEIVN